MGKGLGALFGNSAAQANASSERVSIAESVAPSSTLQVPIDNIDPNPRQPRSEIADANVQSLSESIREVGIIQPLIVTLRPSTGESGPRYVIIAGERRWRAAKLAGLKVVPVVVKTATPQQMLEMALVENLQREDLNPIEIARAYQMLVEEYSLSHDEIGRRVGKDRSTISNHIALLRLPIEIQDVLESGVTSFTPGHAKAIMGIDDNEEQVRLMKQIMAQNLSVRHAEDLARSAKEAALRLTQDRKGKGPSSTELAALEDEFRRAIALQVQIRRNAKGAGSITISFANQDELDAIYEMLVLRGQNEEY
jgi:ParB family transcriptional regulator, chromosome partitioning protein